MRYIHVYLKERERDGERDGERQLAAVTAITLEMPKLSAIEREREREREKEREDTSGMAMTAASFELPT